MSNSSSPVESLEVYRVKNEIDQCLFEQNSRLRISYYSLSVIPEKLSICKHLTDLELSFLKIESLEGLNGLINLRKLNLDGNIGLTTLSKLSTLPNLKKLSAQFCSLENVNTICSLPLVYLNLNGNSIKHISFEQLPKSLIHLVLSCNFLISEPDAIIELPNLQHLVLHTNLNLKLRLRNMIALKFLDIQYTSIDFSDSVDSCLALEYLYNASNISSWKSNTVLNQNIRKLTLRNIHLKEIPEHVLALKGLEVLDVAYNLINVFPPLHKLEEYNVQWKKLNIGFNYKMSDFPTQILTIPTLRALVCSIEILEDNIYLDPIERIELLRQKFNIQVPNVQIDKQKITKPSSPEEIKRHENIYLDILAREKIVKNPTTSVLVHREELADKIAGCIFGAAIGDAVGLASEFLSKQEAYFYYDQIEFDNFHHDSHRRRWLPGDWTDDTDQAILILKDFINHGNVSEIRFAHDIDDWSKHGLSEMGDLGGSGCGRQTATVLSQKKFFENPHLASEKVWLDSNKMSAPNGAVMRTFPLGIISYWDQNEVETNAIKIAKVTHFDPRCIADSVAISKLIASILSGEKDKNALLQCVQDVGEKYLEGESLEEYNKYVHSSLIDLELSNQFKGIGYTHRSFGSAIWALRNNELGFEETISQIALEGGDADTNAVVAGAVLGAYFGFSKLPSRWVAGLRHSKYLTHLVGSIFDVYGIL